MVILVYNYIYLIYFKRKNFKNERFFRNVSITNDPIGVQKPGSQYSPAIYTMDIAYKIDIPWYIFDRYITGI